jgi:hypothetical protein
MAGSQGGDRAILHIWPSSVNVYGSGRFLIPDVPLANQPAWMWATNNGQASYHAA